MIVEPHRVARRAIAAAADDADFAERFAGDPFVGSLEVTITLPDEPSRVARHDRGRASAQFVDLGAISGGGDQPTNRLRFDGTASIGNFDLTVELTLVEANPNGLPPPAPYSTSTTPLSAPWSRPSPAPPKLSPNLTHARGSSGSSATSPHSPAPCR